MTHRVMTTRVFARLACLLVLLLPGCAGAPTPPNALLQAAAAGNNDEVARLLNDHFDVGRRDAHGDTALHVAIRNQHPDTAELLIAKGANVNAAGWLEDTPLHVSVYAGENDVSALLIQQGADQSLRNRYGLTPTDMRAVPAIRDDIAAAASLLTIDGGWTDERKGRGLYRKLETQPHDAVVDALVLSILNDTELRLRVLILAIKLGIAKSEQQLVAVLMQFGDKSMAEDYLNSGSGALAEGGRTWANQRGYEILTGEGSHRAAWGSF